MELRRVVATEYGREGASLKAEGEGYSGKGFVLAVMLVVVVNVPVMSLR